MGYGIERGIGYKNSPNPISLSDLAEEMIRARDKFPRNHNLFLALFEEVGELAKAVLQREGAVRITSEALQVACIAMRIYEEGDPAFFLISDDAAKK